MERIFKNGDRTERRSITASETSKGALSQNRTQNAQKLAKKKEQRVTTGSSLGKKKNPLDCLKPQLHN